MDTAAVAQQLGVDPAQGLSTSEAADRLRTAGPNRLAGAKKESGFKAFVRQYQDFMQIILLGAAIVNAIVTDEAGTTILLAGLTVLNAVIGLRQEAKAEESVAALAQMMKTIARVRRGGQAIEIDAQDLVPGDVVLRANDSSISSAKELERFAGKLNEKELAVLYIQRGPGDKVFLPVRKSSG